MAGTELVSYKTEDLLLVLRCLGKKCTTIFLSNLFIFVKWLESMNFNENNIAVEICIAINQCHCYCMFNSSLSVMFAVYPAGLVR